MTSAESVFQITVQHGAHQSKALSADEEAAAWC